MKVALVLVLALAVVATVADDDKYSTKYDNVNLDEILANRRLLDKYSQCLMEDDEANCTADGKELKKVIPDALANDCAKCNEKQKTGADKVLRFLVNKRTDIWEKLKAKFDPNMEYSKKYEDRERKLHA